MMPKEVSKAIKIYHFRGIGLEILDLGAFYEKKSFMVFDWPTVGLGNQKDQKNKSAEATKGTSRSDAEEGGRGEVNLPPSERRKVRRIGRKEGDLHADPVGRRIFLNGQAKPGPRLSSAVRNTLFVSLI